MKLSAQLALVSLAAAATLLFVGVSHASPLPPQENNAAHSTTISVSMPAAPDHDTVPRLLQFAGTLKDASARPLAGPASVTFALYAEQDGGTALWSETQNVLADSNGHFNVLLGAATSAGMPAELFGTGQSRWLGVTVARHEEMPRVLLASVPYALRAADAETLGGLPASAYVTNETLAARLGTAPQSTTVLATPQVSAAQSAATVSAATASAAVPNAVPSGGGITNYLPLWTSSDTLSDSLLYQNGGNIGIGTTTPTETLDVNGNSIFRGSFQLPPGHPATASSGYESHSFQFQASSFNSTTGTSNTEAFGFRAEPLNNNTPNPSAKLDLFFGAGGSAPFTDTGLSFAANGIMTFAPGQTFSGVSETLSGSLNLPNTTNSTTGVINLGGFPVINDFASSTNIFVGAGSGGAFTGSASSMFNTALGEQSMYSIVDGTINTAVGAASLYRNTEGNSNTAVGAGALDSVVTGSGNVALGRNAGQGADGNNGTFIGLATGPTTNNLTFATAIGANATVSVSNAIVLGPSGNAAPAVGIGTGAPAHTLDVVDRGVNLYGIYATSAYDGDSAIAGINNSTTGDSNGGLFQSVSPNGSGLVAVNDSGGYAGYFEAISPGYAGFFFGQVAVLGNMSVSGTLSKGAGSFKIDDPIDPGGKYLSHSFVESPDMMNIYNGNVVTNAKGYAVVTLPEWFEALNSDFRYQLTPVGQFSQAMIARKIKDRKFTIRSSKPHVEISWQVTGIRHDAYANAHRIPTEEVKPPNEQGHYLHPELFGAGPEQGIGATAMAANAAAGNKNH